MGSPSRLRSIRTRCTCCRPGRAGESGLDRTHTHVRSSTSRTIRSASRRRGVHEADPDRTRIHARSLSNRNVCILSPSQFSFRKVVYQTNPPHAIPTPISIPDWKSATLELATLPHWQHSRPRPVGRAHTLARPSGCLRQCSLRGFASSVHVLGEPRPCLHKSHDITSRATVSMNCIKRV